MSILLFSPGVYSPLKKYWSLSHFRTLSPTTEAILLAFLASFPNWNAAVHVTKKFKKDLRLWRKRVCVCVWYRQVSVCYTKKFQTSTLSTHHNFSVDLSGTPVICWFVSPFPFFFFLFSCCGNNYLPWLTINGAPTIVSCLLENQRPKEEEKVHCSFLWVSDWKVVVVMEKPRNKKSHCSNFNFPDNDLSFNLI